MLGTMDLTLSRRGDYVVRAAIALANSWRSGGYTTISEVADDMEIPRTFAPQVLGDLARAGFAESKAGRSGGYRLSRPPSKISMLEVVESAEGVLISERCPIRDGPCRWNNVCAIHPTWAKVSEAVRSTLSRAPLSQIAGADRGSRPA
jgi:Rrf2 family transcriptional regulator, iron-sulfur cluster assembly transcription factor